MRRGGSSAVRPGQNAPASGPYRFDEAAASRAVEFIERLLRHTTGKWSGQPFKLMEWQRERVIRPLFGWKRSDGTRRYRYCYIEIPRKNGKSALGAAIALALLYADDEPGAMIYSCAGDRSQARIIFEAASNMVRQAAPLAKLSNIYRNSIFFRRAMSRYEVISADAPTKHGLNPHGVMFDELHVQPTRELWDTMSTAVGARRQPMIVAITTAGWDRRTICWDIHKHAMSVAADPSIDPEFLPVIYAADPKDPWDSPETWRKANPSLNVTIDESFLASECKRAKEMPSYENTFRRLYLNQWTEQSERWLPMEKWDVCGDKFDLESFHGEECWAALDLSTSTDTTALVLLFERDNVFYVWPHFWVPSETTDRRERREKIKYREWAQLGYMEMCDGPVISYERVLERIDWYAARVKIKEIAIDRWNASNVGTELQRRDIPVVAFGQGFASMSAPTKCLEALVLSGGIRHNKHPVLRWMASNVAIEREKQDPAGNIKPHKGRSADKIDGIVALIMALGRAQVDVTRGARLLSDWITVI